MSIKLMSRVWEADFPPTEKLVLLAMADFANDEGLCWPSVATVAKKTGVSERTIQRTLRWAEDEKLLTREEIVGVGCRYVLHGRHGVTGDKVSPPSPGRGTGDKVSPKPSRTVSTSRAKALSVARALEAAYPHGPPAEWVDWAVKELGWPIHSAHTEQARFMDSCRAHDRRYKDWMAAWRSWCRSPFCKTKPLEEATAYRKEPMRV